MAPLFPNREAELASDIVLSIGYGVVFLALIGGACAFRARIYPLAVPDHRQPRITCVRRSRSRPPLTALLLLLLL
jgi:hypothetical protein